MIVLEICTLLLFLKTTLKVVLISPFIYIVASSIMKRLESVNTIVSSVWWMCGFYWIVVGGQTLLQDSPRLYW